MIALVWVAASWPLNAGAEDLVLTPEKVIQMTLENNVKIQLAIIDYQIARAEVLASRFESDVNLTLNPAYKNDINLPNSTLDRAEVNETTYSASLGLKKKFPWGLSGEFVYQEMKIVSDSLRTTLPVSFRSAAQLKLTQPFLKGAGTEAAQSVYQKARVKHARYWWELRESINDELLKSYGLFWDLYEAQANLREKTELAKGARELLKETEALKNSGLKNFIDVLQARARSLLAESNLLTAQAKIFDVRERLLREILPLKQDSSPNLIVNEDLPSLDFALNRSNDSAKPATAKLERMRYEIEENLVDVKKAENAKLIQLDLSGQYLTTGLSNDIEGARQNMWKTENPSYQGMLTITIPLGNSGARGEYARAVAAQTTKELTFQEETRANILEESKSQLEIHKSKESLASIDARLALERELFKFKSKSFHMGRISWRELIEAQDSLTELLENRSRVAAELHTQYSKWLSTVGAFAVKEIDGFFQRKNLRGP